MACCIPVYASGQTINIISTMVGDGTTAQLNGPYGVAVDSSGNLYVTDSGNNYIHKVDTNGNSSTVAGNGTAGYTGDGGPATSASLKAPRSVALDGAGNIYIADCSNHVIRKVDTSGNISTVAGNGTRGYTGDGGVATSANLASPSGVALDSAGNIYIADYANYVIRKVDTSGNISTVAGNGTRGYTGDGGVATSANLASPSGVALDSAGNIYIADYGNHVIRKVDTSGKISTVAGNGTAAYAGDGGPATSASLRSPRSVALDSAGNIYIADYGNHVIRKVDTSGNISTEVGIGTYGYTGDDGLAIEAQLNSPADVVITTTGKLYIADKSNNCVRLVTPVLVDPTVPTWPDKTLTVSELGATSLTLNWNPAFDDIDVIGYKVYQGTTLLTDKPVSGLDYIISELTQNTQYTFTVQAVDGDGNESLYGPKITVTTLDATPPTWISGNLTYSRLVADSVTLNWSGAVDNLNSIKGYKLYQGTSLLTDELLSEASYIVSGLNPGTQYTFTVQAVDTSGNESTDGPSLNVITNMYDVESPTWNNGSLTYSNLGATSVTLNWSGAVDNVGIKGFNVKIYKGTDTSNLIEEKTFTDSSCTLELMSALDYTFKVEAIDANENKSNDGPQLTITTPEIALGITVPVVTGHPMTFTGGIVVDLGTMVFTPGAVTLQVNELHPDPIPGLKIGGKFIDPQFTGWTPRYDNAMKITLPLNEGVDPAKASIYYSSGTSWRTQTYPAFDRSPSRPANFTADDYSKGLEIVDNSLRVICANASQGILSDYGIWTDTEVKAGHTFDVTSIKSNEIMFRISAPVEGQYVYPDPSGIIGWKVYRNNILLDDYRITNLSPNGQYNATFSYTDSTVQAGNTYKYNMQIVDWFGNVSDMLGEITVTVTDDAGTVAAIKNMDLFTFADGDSAICVTQNLNNFLKSVSLYPDARINWTSSNTSIIDPSQWGKVTRPTDTDSVNVKLIATITCGTVTDTKEYDLTVCWTETSNVRTFDEFTVALGRALVKDIILTGSISGAGTYDGHEKVVIPNLSSSQVFSAGSPSLNLGNLTFNGNNVTNISKVVSVSNSRMLNFDNVTFQGTDAFEYLIYASDNDDTQQYEVVANNCRFSPVKNHAFFATTSSSDIGKTGYGKQLTLTSNIFAEGANIRIQAGTASIINNTIKSRFEACKGATINGIAITDAVSAETAVNALLTSEAGNQFTAPTDGSYGIVIYDTDGTTVLYQTLQTADKTAPVLTPDTTNNTVNQPIELTFTDNADWIAAITGITVDGIPLDNAKYATTADSITIDGSIFTSPDSYLITVKATGYTDASVTQTINAAGIEAPVLQSTEVTNQGDASVTFDKEMADPSGKEAQFAVKVDGIDVSITSVQLATNKNKIKLILATKIMTGQTVTVAYTKGDNEAGQVNSTDGGILETFAAQTATNGSSLTPTTQVTLTLSAITAKTGDSITAIGTADPGSWVAIKIVDGAGNIVYFDTVKADDSGNYTNTCIVPEFATGDLNVIAGYGYNVARQTLTVSEGTIDECFIATASFGSKFEPSVVLLRAFRDKFLLTNTWGQAFVKFYYKNSPPIAAYIANNEFLKAGVRGLLTPVVGVVYLLFHPALLYSVVSALILLIAAIFFLKRRRGVTGRV